MDFNLWLEADVFIFFYDSLPMSSTTGSINRSVDVPVPGQPEAGVQPPGHSQVTARGPCGGQVHAHPEALLGAVSTAGLSFQ